MLFRNLKLLVLIINLKKIKWLRIWSGRNNNCKLENKFTISQRQYGNSFKRCDIYILYIFQRILFQQCFFQYFIKSTWIKIQIFGSGLKCFFLITVLAGNFSFDSFNDVLYEPPKHTKCTTFANYVFGNYIIDAELFPLSNIG